MRHASKQAASSRLAMDNACPFPTFQWSSIIPQPTTQRESSYMGFLQTPRFKVIVQMCSDDPKKWISGMNIRSILHTTSLVQLLSLLDIDISLLFSPSNPCSTRNLRSKKSWPFWGSVRRESDRYVKVWISTLALSQLKLKAFSSFAKKQVRSPCAILNALSGRIMCRAFIPLKCIRATVQRRFSTTICRKVISAGPKVKSTAICFSVVSN